MSKEGVRNIPVRVQEELWERASIALTKRRQSFQTYLENALQQLVSAKQSAESHRATGKKDQHQKAASSDIHLGYTDSKPENPEVLKLQSMLGAILASTHARAKSAIAQNIEAFYELVCQSSQTGMMSDAELHNRIDAAVRAARASLQVESASGRAGGTADPATRKDSSGSGRAGKRTIGREKA